MDACISNCIIGIRKHMSCMEYLYYPTNNVNRIDVKSIAITRNAIISLRSLRSILLGKSRFSPLDKMVMTSQNGDPTDTWDLYQTDESVQLVSPSNAEQIIWPAYCEDHRSISGCSRLSRADVAARVCPKN